MKYKKYEIYTSKIKENIKNKMKNNIYRKISTKRKVI